MAIMVKWCSRLRRGWAEDGKLYSLIWNGHICHSLFLQYITKLGKYKRALFPAIKTHCFSFCVHFPAALGLSFLLLGHLCLLLVLVLSNKPVTEQE